MESQHIEYKSKLIPEIEKSVVAFLNSREGGVLYIGLDKHGNIVGLNHPDQDQILLSSRLRNNIVPSCMGLFDILLEKREGQYIIKLIVASGYEKPYYLKKIWVV